jgi:putative ABC transport system permease protein
MRRLWMEMAEGCRISWAAIRAHKMRSGLTLLGIIIGIVTVTLMVTAIEGLNGAFTKGISSMGADVLFVQRFAWFTGDREWWKMRNRRDITYKLAKEIEKEATLARAVAPAAFTTQFINRGVRSGGNVNIVGTTEEYALTEGLSLGDGRFLSSIDVLGGRPVCVIGYAIATKLFPGESPLGKKLSVAGRNFEVVGVMEKRGSFLGIFSLDEEVLVPITRYIGVFDNNPDLLIEVKSSSMGQIEETNEELEGLLRKLRKIPPGEPDDFAINRQSIFIENFKKVGGTIASIGIFITGLSLFVGGIGIMNIMFVSVTERTREIGLRKALGARRRTILLQFLTEAVMICLIGGAAAIALTYPISLIISRFLPTSMSWVVISIALAVSALTGVVSGFMPAYRASKMSPVEALRAE